MARTTCQNCDRTVVLVDLGERQVMLDPEIITVVPAKHRQASARSDGSGSVSMSGASTFARRLHSEMCEAYQAQAQRARIAAEQRAYNRKHGRPAARKMRGP